MSAWYCSRSSWSQVISWLPGSEHRLFGGKGVAGVLEAGDFLPQTERVEAARITATAVTRERGPNFIQDLQRRAATRGPGNRRRVPLRHVACTRNPHRFAGKRWAIGQARGAV